ncbi:MAG TPA: ATP-binding protein [Pyrinomonadaceae bacterium]|nr:ATP-binding protein [Pyrinomonadaceae bacterium]
MNTPAISSFNRSIRATFQSESPVRVQFYNEALDVLRIPNEKYESEMVAMLQKKYSGEQIDLIICLAGDALKFVLKHEAQLFPAIPKVFVTHDRREVAEVALGQNVAGVVGKIELAPIIKDALRLQPEVNRVVVVGGSSPLDQFWLEQARQEFQQFQGRLEFVYLTDATIQELKTQIAALPPRTIVCVVSVTLDRLGTSYSSVEALGLLAPASNAPVYGPLETQLGNGIVGGPLFSYELLGREGARTAIRIMAGEKPADLGVQTVDNVLMFDWRQLRRWNISEAALPAGSQLRFKEPSFWELYKWRIVGVVTLIVVQTLFIAGLLIERRRRRRAKEALDRLNAELEQRVSDRTAALDAKSRELETFAYSVAHDLKAPLRGIDGYSRLLLEDYFDKLDEDGRLFVKTINSSSNEMNQLIEDLLDYSRLERSEIKPGRVELKPLVASVVEQKKRETSGRRIDFIVKVNGGDVLADVNGLTQALRNYVDNAIKFTSNREEARIEIGSEETDKTCVLWVRDNGVGFDMKYHESIFGIFQRLNRTEEYPGTGIGLAIVRKAMERMGGRAWATSEPDKGSTFFMEIPRPR